MNIRIIQACLVFALLGTILKFTLAEPASVDDVNEVGNLLSGVLGVLGIGIVLIIVVAIIMGIMSWSKY